jgi:RimK family alpha-L-glutamate ligase
MQGIPLFNSARTVDICDDKAKTAIAFAKAGLPTPKTVLAPKTFDTVGYNDLTFLTETEDLLSYPMVIKETCGSFGAQVYLAHDRKEAIEIILKIKHKDFILQEYIAESTGRDIRANVVGGEVVCCMLRENEKDFRSNISGGGKAKPYTPTADEKRVAIEACKAVDADFAGVDILFGKNGPIVCEINSNPHFKSTLDCTGVDLSGYILEHIGRKLV